MRRLYTLLLYLGLPAAALIIAVRAWRERSAERPARAGWRERLGFGPARAGGGIWVHAVSVGEVHAAAILIEALRAGGAELTLSCATPSARARARALLPGVEVRYAPYDLPGAQRRCLARLRPRLLVLIESELWPNLLHEAHRGGVPTLIASARVSARSARLYGRLPGLLRAAMRANVWIGAQSGADAQRYRALGVPAARISVCGNIKFDRRVPEEVRMRGAALRAQYAAGRALWVAGSIHPRETPIVLEAHRRVRERWAQALLVLAPRHAYRFEESATGIEAAGLTYQRRSRPPSGAPGVGANGAPSAVLLLDTLGELMDFYAAADVAFVGGSLVSVGGHNLLEPAALGVPVLTGAQHFNSPEVARVLGEQGALTIVTDAVSLAQRLQELLGDEAARARQGARAQAVLQAHRGALTTLLGLIAQLLARPALEPAPRATAP